LSSLIGQNENVRWKRGRGAQVTETLGSGARRGADEKKKKVFQQVMRLKNVIKNRDKKGRGMNQRPKTRWFQRGDSLVA
jgi:hypothetical protein